MTKAQLCNHGNRKHTHKQPSPIYHFHPASLINSGQFCLLDTKNTTTRTKFSKRILLLHSTLDSFSLLSVKQRYISNIWQYYSLKIKTIFVILMLLSSIYIFSLQPIRNQNNDCGGSALKNVFLLHLAIYLVLKKKTISTASS